MKRSPIRCNLGIDVGTKALRAALYRSADGAAVAEDALPLRVDGGGGHREMDFDHVWSTLQLAIDRVAAQLRTAVLVERVALSSTASTVACLDATARPLGPGILWADHRALAEADEIKQTGHPVLQRMLGHVSPEWGLSKFLFLARHGQLTGPSVAKVAELVDWLNWRLTGRLVANAGIAEWGWCADENGGCPDDMMERLGIARYRCMLPDEYLVTGETIGPIASSVADRHPFLRDSLLTMGGMDSYVAAQGMGVVKPGRLCVSFGSSSAFIVSAESGVPGRMYGPMRAILPGAVGYWHGGQSTVGLAVDWVKKLLRRSDSSLELEAALIPPGSDGLLFRETLVDRRSPCPRANMRGRWEGLSLEHGPAHLFRSVLEGIAFGARYALDSVEPRDVVAAGGLAKSDLFLQIVADVFERPISRLRHREAAAFGAAFAHDAARIPELNPVVEMIQPLATEYGKVFARYRRLHEADQP